MQGEACNTSRVIKADFLRCEAKSGKMAIAAGLFTCLIAPEDEVW